MKRSTARLASPATIGRSPRQPKHDEQEARKVAQDTIQSAAAPMVSQLPPHSQIGSERLVPGSGKPLAPAERGLFQQRFGRDFSQVRVHTGQQAAQAAEQMDAQAFTIGNHIVFGADQYAPYTLDGQGLMAHELTHTLQQGMGQSNIVQRQEKDSKHGIGSAPPKEPFIIAKGVGAEDTHVLFDKDEVTVSAGSQKTLIDLFGNHKTPVTVEIHGYASAEGDTEYNTNLSAHRAAAIKALILSYLPPGSSVLLYAHGETQAFGDLSANRRAGIRVLADVSPTSKAAEQPKDAPSQPATTDTPPPVVRVADPNAWLLGPARLGTPSITPNPGLLPKPSLLPGGSILPPLDPLQLKPPPLIAPPMLDWQLMQDPFRARGVILTDRDAKAIEQNWSFTYQFLRSLNISPAWAAWGANKGTALAYDMWLAKENPNFIDLSNKQMEKMLPPGQSITSFSIPILTPTTLNPITKKLFGLDLSKYYY